MSTIQIGERAGELDEAFEPAPFGTGSGTTIGRSSAYAAIIDEGARRLPRNAAALTAALTALGLAACALAACAPAAGAPTAGAPAADAPAAASQHAETRQIRARIVGIHDGDTVTILDGDNHQHRVRLAGVDAPELGQPGGRRSRESLSQLVFAQPVRLEWRKRDRFGRLVGTLWVAAPEAACRGSPECPATLDTSLAQLERGHAWWFRHYANEQPPGERARYEAAEREARQQRLGLWRDRDPVPPWTWRRRGEPRQPLLAPAPR